jgi:hypothetical protein
MAASGMLAQRSVAHLVGEGMWSPNLAIYVWTGAVDSFFVKVLSQDCAIEVWGSSKWVTISRAEEVLVLFATSGNGPQGRLVNPSVWPWTPLGDVLVERSSAKVIEMAHAKAMVRLYYTNWNWSDTSRAQAPHSPDPGLQLSVVRSHGRSLLGWFEDTRGEDEDFKPERETLPSFHDFPHISARIYGG